MSVLQKSAEGFVISHVKFINRVYENVNSGLDSLSNYVLQRSLFKINTPFRMNSQVINVSEDIHKPTFHSSSSKRKRKRIVIDGEAGVIQVHMIKICDQGKAQGIFTAAPSEEDLKSNNVEAREMANKLYQSAMFLPTSALCGGNTAEMGLVTWLEKEPYLIPPRCKFFSYDVRDMAQKLSLLEPPYDLVLLDPPWWNKYIRRKKAHCKSSSYEMMYSNELARIPIKKLISADSLIVVWCTNCETHLNTLYSQIFPAWGVEYVAKWFWVKVTSSGEPVCKFAKPPRKQPFEQIIFAKSQKRSSKLRVPEDNKVIVSVPSAIHSHKPPLAEVLTEYLPSNPVCLELFARYLLPNWTSWGLEVLLLQHLSLYEKVANANTS